MKIELHSFLNSNLLYNYLVGETNTVESTEVEYYINKYPEAKAAYNTLQNNLEIHAKVYAVEAPIDVLDNVLNTLEGTTEPKIIKMVQPKNTPWHSIAASVAAILFAVTSFLLYQKNKELNNENNKVVDEIFDLRSDIDKNNAILNELSEQMDKLNNPDAQKYVLTGNERAKDLKTVAYINPVNKTSMIDVIMLPQLPEEQYYQMWAELQGRMVNLGILDEADRSKLKQIPYMEDASALSITIETKGSVTTNSTTNEVAEISLRED